MHLELLNNVTAYDTIVDNIFDTQRDDVEVRYHIVSEDPQRQRSPKRAATTHKKKDSTTRLAKTTA